MNYFHFGLKTAPVQDLQTYVMISSMVYILVYINLPAGGLGAWLAGDSPLCFRRRPRLRLRFIRAYWRGQQLASGAEPGRRRCGNKICVYNLKAMEPTIPTSF